MPEYRNSGRPRGDNRKYEGLRRDRPRRAVERARAVYPPNRVQPAGPSRAARPPVAARPYVATRKKVKKNYIIHYMLLAVASVVIVSILSVTVLFNVNRIVVEGDSVYTNEEIAAAGGITAGMNLIRFDAVQAEADITDNLIYINDVKVEKRYPASLVVTVEAAKRELTLLSGGKYYSISPKKRILEVTGTRPDGLIVIGCDPEERDAGDYLTCSDEGKVKLVFELADMVAKHGLSQVTEIDVTDRLDVSLLCGDRVEIKLGAPSELNEKLTVAGEMLKSYIEHDEKGVLRLSNPRKVTFKPDLGG